MQELKWTKTHSGSSPSWTAIGSRGTHWEIVQRRGRLKYFAIYVEHWDTADWTADSFEEATRLVAEIDARPPIPREQQIPEQSPVAVVDGDQFVPWEDDEPPVAVWSDCLSCGSGRRPECVKPIRHTPEWWMDPQPTWRCPDCKQERGRS